MLQVTFSPSAYIRTLMNEALQASPLELAGIILFLAALLGLVLVFGVRHRIAAARAEQQRADELMNRVIRERSLAPSQVETLRVLHSYQRRPAHLRRLLDEYATFEKMGDRAIGDGLSSASAVTALRVQLGHRAARDGAATRSTAGIPVGGEVDLTRGDRAQRATVTAILPDGLQVTPESPGSLRPGNAVTLSHSNGAGLYSWAISVLAVDGKAVLLSHSRTPHRVQRRAWYRRRISAAVQLLGPDEEVIAEGTLQDLSGGGAAISGFPERIGSPIRLSLPEFDLHAVPADVIRRSRGLLHVRFANLRDVQRDRLVRIALSRGSSGADSEPS